MLLHRNSFMKSWLILSAIRVIWHIPTPPIVMDAAAPRLIGPYPSQAFGLATVRVYHRRALELNR
jgi:hypothetical protein